MSERVELLDGRAVLYCGDCLEVCRSMPDDSVDLVFGSPPYPKARTYGIGFSMDSEAWATWMVERWREWQRISRGAVCMVVDDSTEDFAYGGGPLLLGANLLRAGLFLRHPGAYERDGVPGSGGPDWLKTRFEFIICTTKGKLLWSDNKACGWPCKYGHGGHPSNRCRSGHHMKIRAAKRHPDKTRGGGKDEFQSYKPPDKANPGNIICPEPCDVVKCGAGGGGQIGSKIAHENEAPFPEAIAERFVKSFCPPGGLVLDPWGGSGTTMAVALKNGRKSISIDVRESQIELMKRRAAEVEDAAPLFMQGDT